MFSLLRTTFWVGLILLLLPIGTGDDNTPSIGIVQVYLAAQSTLRDLSGFCERNPDACEMGSSVITLVGLKAKEAARLTYDYLSDSESGDSLKTQVASFPETREEIETIAFDEVASGQTLPALDDNSGDPVYSGALTSADRDIPWQLNQSDQDTDTNQGLFAEARPTYLVPAATVPVPRPNPLHDRLN